MLEAKLDNTRVRLDISISTLSASCFVALSVVFYLLIYKDLQPLLKKTINIYPHNGQSGAEKRQCASWCFR